MAREMEEAKRKAAEAARRKRAAEKRAREDAEKAARLQEEAAEAQRLANEAAAAREAELKKLREDEANSFWLQEALRLEQEAARKRKQKAKAAVSKKDTVIPKDLQVSRLDTAAQPTTCSRWRYRTACLTWGSNPLVTESTCLESSRLTCGSTKSTLLFVSVAVGTRLKTTSMTISKRGRVSRGMCS